MSSSDFHSTLLLKGRISPAERRAAISDARIDKSRLGAPPARDATASFLKPNRIPIRKKGDRLVLINPVNLGKTES